MRRWISKFRSPKSGNGAHSEEALFTTFDRILPREAKEQLLGQRGLVIWLYGLSGSGKSTLAIMLERKLHEQGRLVRVLDGDNVRSGLNCNLGFCEQDRQENIRRVAEVAKLFCETGVITIASFITPKEAMRSEARHIIGESDFLEVYVKASFQACQQRDPKGLYAKVNRGEVSQFTGKDSDFEEPEAPEVTIETESQSEEESLETLYQSALKRVYQSFDFNI